MFNAENHALRGAYLPKPAAPLEWAEAIIALAPAPAPAAPNLKNAIQRGLILARWRGGEVVGGPPTLRMVERTLEEGGRAVFAFDNARVARRIRDTLHSTGVRFDEPEKENAQ